MGVCVVVGAAADMAMLAMAGVSRAAAEAAASGGGAIGDRRRVRSWLAAVCVCVRRVASREFVRGAACE